MSRTNLQKYLASFLVFIFVLSAVFAVSMLHPKTTHASFVDNGAWQCFTDDAGAGETGNYAIYFSGVFFGGGTYEYDYPGPVDWVVDPGVYGTANCHAEIWDTGFVPVPPDPPPPVCSSVWHDSGDISYRTTAGGMQTLPCGYALTGVGYASDDHQCILSIQSKFLRADKTIDPSDPGTWDAVLCALGGGGHGAQYISIPVDHAVVGWSWGASTGGGTGYSPPYDDTTPGEECYYQEYTNLATGDIIADYAGPYGGTCSDFGRGVPPALMKAIVRAPAGKVITGMQFTTDDDAPLKWLGATSRKLNPICPSGYASDGAGNCNPTALVNDAQYISQIQPPATMTAGQTSSVSITMKNTGTTTWTAAALHRLGSQNPGDNTTWGLSRVDVPSSVAPGDTVTYTFNVTAPSTPGPYNFQWQSVQDNVGWFGDITPNVVVTVNPATETNCSDGVDNDVDGLTDSADSDCAAPAPGSFTLDSIGSGSSAYCDVTTSKVSLAWSASSNVTSYSVYRGGALYASLGNVTSYIDTAAGNGISRTYFIRATNASSHTDSNQISVTTADCTPPAPNVIFNATPASVSSGNASDLSWTVSGSVNTCTASGDWSGAKSPSGGSQSTGALFSNKSYTLSCEGDGGTTVKTANVTVTAAALTLTIIVNPNSGGTVKSDDGLINCGVGGADCSETYAGESLVGLTATPASTYWKFSGWTGDCLAYGTNPLCSLVIDSPKTATATFVPRPLNYIEF